jgi:hypothetical protein
MTSCRNIPPPSSVSHIKSVLSVVLYEFQIWALTIREGYTLRVFEDSMIRRIFGHDKDGGCYRRKHYIICTPPNDQIKDKVNGHVACMHMTD